MGNWKVLEMVGHLGNSLALPTADRMAGNLVLKLADELDLKLVGLMAGS